MRIKRRYIFGAIIVAFLFFLTHSTPSVRPTKALGYPQDQPDPNAFEAKQTAKALGVPVQIFPPPQGLAGFDELPANAPRFTFTLKPRRRTGPPPPVYFDRRKLVAASAPDGTLYEAYCGNDEDAELMRGHGFVSTSETPRQWHGSHHGYGFMPQNVYIGKREQGRIKPVLFFRDIGSHANAPHSLAIDDHGMAHLVVADVNTSQGNQLDLYWVIGDPRTGKWNSAWQVDRRGFTSWSRPWSGAWSDKVHLIWDWCDVSINKYAPGMGAFHVEWSANGFGRKTRIFPETVRQLGAALDQTSGLLVIALARDKGGVYVLSRSAEGKWTRPALLHPRLKDTANISIEAELNGNFLIKVGSNSLIGGVDDSRDWLLRPL